MIRYSWTSGRTVLLHEGLPPPIPPGLRPAGRPPPTFPGLRPAGRPRPRPPGSGSAASPDRGQGRPATSRCCARPAGTVHLDGGLPPPIPPGLRPAGRPLPRAVPGRGRPPARNPCSWGRARIGLIPPPRAVPDRSPQPATTRCSWGPERKILRPGGLPPPRPPGLLAAGFPPPRPPDPARPASCRARPPSPVPAGLLPLPATTPCCGRPGSADHARPPSPGSRSSLVPARPARSRCSSGPGRTGPARAARRPGPGRPAPLAPARSARTGQARTVPQRGVLPPPMPPGLLAGRRPRPMPPGPGPAARTGRARSTRTRPRRPRGARVRTMPGRAPATATLMVPALKAAAPAVPPTAARPQADRRRRRTGRGRTASAPRPLARRPLARRPSARRPKGPGRPIRPTRGHGPARARPARTMRPRARRLGPAARPGLAGRPGRPGPPGRAAWAAAGRRRRGTRLPAGRNRRRNRESPRDAGRAGAPWRRCGEPAARSTSWSPPPSSGRGRLPAVEGDRWPVPGRLAALAPAAASGDRPAGTASNPRA